MTEKQYKDYITRVKRILQRDYDITVTNHMIRKTLKYVTRNVCLGIANNRQVKIYGLFSIKARKLISRKYPNKYYIPNTKKDRFTLQEIPMNKR